MGRNTHLCGQVVGEQDRAGVEVDAVERPGRPGSASLRVTGDVRREDRVVLERFEPPRLDADVAGDKAGAELALDLAFDEEPVDATSVIALNVRRAATAYIAEPGQWLASSAVTTTKPSGPDS